MADEPDQPGQSGGSNPPADESAAVPQPAKRTPARAAKKAPAKKAPVKKAPAKAVKKKAAPKKAPPKVAPPPPPVAAAPPAEPPPEPTPTPAPEPEPQVAEDRPPAAALAETNGERQVDAAAANEAAARAKRAVDTAGDSLGGTIARVPSTSSTPVNIAVALALSLLAILLIRRLLDSE